MRLDATAGQTARSLSEHPDEPRRNLDSTDRRFGEDRVDRDADPEPVVDATDPRYGCATD